MATAGSSALSSIGPIAQLRGGRLGRRLTQLYVGLTLYGLSMALLIRCCLEGPLEVFNTARPPVQYRSAPCDHVGLIVLLLWLPEAGDTRPEPSACFVIG